ncbi:MULTISPECIES: hypothetical protein [Halolamina]|uniref:Uncharacterized protein n=1 Tax=Halolamina pelagica TaxID=699431 RepID=A0A1I5VPS9_9EURY|nr:MULTISPECIES: hypothetical protein [Halolamina]SFQ09277.1 hypothetical protein SAMN05216277_11916 [Halolamina pelagica]
MLADAAGWDWWRDYFLLTSITITIVMLVAELVLTELEAGAVTGR